jgi:hypothetical protein
MFDFAQNARCGAALLPSVKVGSNVASNDSYGTSNFASNDPKSRQSGAGTDCSLACGYVDGTVPHALPE